MLADALRTAESLFIRQRKEWLEIAIDWETANRYAVMDESQNVIGMLAEHAQGFFARFLLRSHRGFEMELMDNTGESLLRLSRNFFWFFSDLTVARPNGEVLGSVHRRFGILYKKYDLRDASGRLFATVSSPIWRLWTFPIIGTSGQAQGAEVAKKWGGALREIFTDADTFRVNFGTGSWSEAERAVILACAISIDFDFFENNQGSGGVAGLLRG